jgi:hypothetical protein
MLQHRPAFTYCCFFILLTGLLVFPQAAYSDSLNIRVNPLLSYKEQIKEIQKECRAAGNPPACQERIEALQNEEDRLRKHCERRPNDFRCDALKKQKKEWVDPVEELCSKNPYHDKCVRRRENRIRDMRYLGQFCKKQPDAPRCRPKAPPQPKEPYIERYCKNRAHEKRCQRHAEQKKRESGASSNSGRMNTF